MHKIRPQDVCDDFWAVFGEFWSGYFPREDNVLVTCLPRETTLKSYPTEQQYINILQSSLSNYFRMYLVLHLVYLSGVFQI